MRKRKGAIMHRNLNTELDMSTTIAEARDSIKRIEGTTARISNIVNDVSLPTAVHEQLDDQTFSIRFISFVLVCVVALLGMFGVMFFRITEDTSSQIIQMTSRIGKVETKVRELTPPTGITLPSRNLTK